MSSSSTKKEAPNTPRSTAKAAMAFYNTEQIDEPMPKGSQDVIDKAKASRIVDQVFNEETANQVRKRRLENAFNDPPFTNMDLSRIAEKRFLQGREGLQDLEKMEAAVSMANRGKAMSRMSPDQIELEVANELLDLKEAVPGLDVDIGDRSTPIPMIDKDMFLSSAENSPVRKTRSSARRSSRNKKGGTNSTNYNTIRKAQKKKFVDYLENVQSWEGVNKHYNNYLKFTGDPDLLTEEDKLKIFRVTEGSILDKFEARGGSHERLTRNQMKQQQADKFYELLNNHVAFEDADQAFKQYLEEINQPEVFNRNLREIMFYNIESGLATEFDFKSHIVKSKGGKRTRRKKQTKKKRHLKKSTKSRKTKRRKRRTMKK